MADVTSNPDDDITTYWFPVDPSQNDSSNNTYLDTIVDMQVGFYKSGAYSADWSTVSLPASPSNGKWCIRVNSDDGNQMRLYTYNGLKLTWDTVEGGAGATSHLSLSDIGTNTHVQIDTHLGSSANPHGVTQSQVGLSNVDNVADVNQTSLGTVTVGDIDAIANYIAQRGIDDTPVDAEVAKSITSNWAYDHQNNPTNIKHLTDIQLAALHSIFVPAGVAAHTDITSAGSGEIITSVERTALHTKYTNTEARTAAELLGIYNISSHIHKIGCNAHLIWNQTTVQSNSSGTYLTVTGADWIRFDFSPPDWLQKYAVENSKTITITTIKLRGQKINADAGDYITRVIVYQIDMSDTTLNSKPLSIYDDATDIWTTATAQEYSSDFNVNDIAIATEDSIILRIQIQQANANSIRLWGIEATFTIA